jgi:hypothetical protein
MERGSVSKHDVDRLIPEWFNAHRRSVVWFSTPKQAFVRYEGNRPPVVITDEA